MVGTPPLAGGKIFNPDAKIYAPVRDLKSERFVDISNPENIWVYASETTDSNEDPSTELVEEFDAEEIFGLLRHIHDPELPSTLEELRVIVPEGISVTGNNVRVLFTPTTPHCGAAHIIGLAIRVRLERCLPPRFRLFVSLSFCEMEIVTLTNSTVTKQLNDKERIAAAMEVEALAGVIEDCFP
ncbi:hypothetical protein GALMADRAFT_65520 [Galerina marginata CBS 339.88]|uniref:MIP18 family-like domain-containing protein n=1 Tax=Galerina marginata (strain CBS 339.88) TaxID=685588 RepID=A0A067T2U4_GALM3|nr:hypothetical protein GALMADRAFT_65520 [Galerina marginata CBS 339.88]